MLGVTPGKPPVSPPSGALNCWALGGPRGVPPAPVPSGALGSKQEQGLAGQLWLAQPVTSPCPGLGNRAGAYTPERTAERLGARF